MWPRLRLGLIVLAAGAPFYLMPHSVGDTEEALVLHVGELSTFWRSIIGALGLDAAMVSRDRQPLFLWWPSFLSGPMALFIDATRLYAFAALGMAASLLARTTARAVLVAIGFAATFTFTTFFCEWAGGVLFVPMALQAAPVFLVPAALFIEGWAGNVAAPRAFLNARLARADERLTDRP